MVSEGPQGLGGPISPFEYPSCEPLRNFALLVAHRPPNLLLTSLYLMAEFRFNGGFTPLRRINGGIYAALSSFSEPALNSLNKCYYLSFKISRSLALKLLNTSADNKTLSSSSRSVCPTLRLFLFYACLILAKASEYMLR